MMAPKSKKLTRDEFASLLTVGKSCAVLEPPAVIPAEHSARLVGLGYMADVAGRLRMTTPGRARIRKRATAKIKLGHLRRLMMSRSRVPSAARD
jgi:hypothetical protein